MLIHIRKESPTFAKIGNTEVSTVHEYTTLLAAEINLTWIYIFKWNQGAASADEQEPSKHLIKIKGNAPEILSHAKYNFSVCKSDRLYSIWE
jgi:hypothetical protein